MGVMFDLKCDTCEHARGIHVGFGMRGGVEHYHCRHCGRLESREVDTEVVEEPQDRPRCQNHPGRPMSVLSLASEFDDEHGERVRTGIRCSCCRKGKLFGYQSGLWD